jgi:hypothetical protein
MPINLHKKMRVFRVSNYLKKESFYYLISNVNAIWCRQGITAVDDELERLERMWLWPDAKYV